MVNHEAIVSWFLERHPSLNSLVTSFSWPQKWLPGYHDYQVSVQLEGKTYVGRGLADNDAVALTKAISEAFERFVVTSQKISGATAAHQTWDKARASARGELFERDLFFCHYLNRCEFYPLDNIPEEPFSFRQLSERLWREEKVKFRYFSLGNSSDLFGVITVALGTERRGDPFGLIVGLGASSDPATALVKATLECVANTVHAITPGENRQVSFDEFTQEAAKGKFRNQHLALNPAYAEKFEEYFPDSAAVKGERQKKLDLTLISYHELMATEKLMAGIPLAFASAKHTGAQETFFGPATREKINLRRMEDFCERQVTWESIQMFPHPLA